MTVVKPLPDSFRLSFWVRAKDDPEVHQWLTNHPFRSQSAAARALLSVGVSAFLTMESMLQQDSAGEKVEPKAAPQKRPAKAIKPNSMVKTGSVVAQNGVAVVVAEERAIAPHELAQLPSQSVIESPNLGGDEIDLASNALNKLLNQFR